MGRCPDKVQEGTLKCLSTLVREPLGNNTSLEEDLDVLVNSNNLNQ